MGAFLPQTALPGLKKYKYAGEDHSLVSKYVLKPTYTWLVNYLPLWLAPNMVTLLGLMFSVFSFTRAWYYNSDFDGFSTPRWVFFAYAFDVIAYQTLDALDGQQARRTGTSSPLGELFDHCVDAINTSLLTYVWASVANLPKSWVLACQFLCTLNFVVSTWEEYHTHRLYLSVFSGPVEGVLMIAGMEIVVGLVGQQMWEQNVAGGLNFRDVSTLISVVGVLFNTEQAIVNVIRTTKTAKVADLLPFTVLWAGFGIWAFLAWDVISYSMFLPFFLTIAFAFALLVGRIITAHVTSQAYPMWNPLILAPYVGIAGNLLSHLNHRVNDQNVILTVCGVCLGVYSSFVAEIIIEITTYLDIGCLYIKRVTKVE